MIKKIFVLVQAAAVLYMGALILTQLKTTPEGARQVDRTRPLWFLNPWHTATHPASEGQPAQSEPTPAQTVMDEVARARGGRAPIIAPRPAVNAIVTGMEKQTISPTGPVLMPPATGAPAQQAPAQASAKDSAEAKSDPSKPVRITSLIVSPIQDGVMVRGFTSTPVERVEVSTSSSPPRLILEIPGRFEKYTRPIVIPHNPILKSLHAERFKDKMRIVGQLATDKAVVSPVSRTDKQDEFMVNLTLGDKAQSPAAAPSQAAPSQAAPSQAAPAAPAASGTAAQPSTGK